MNISVVIPVFNEEAYIQSCLESLAAQTQRPFEIIVVDNNCTDNTIPIAKKYGAKILKEDRQGMIFARNAGFNKASGDIIARCDADTIVAKDWISRIRKNFNDKQIIALAGPFNYYDAPFAGKNSFLINLYIKVMAFILNQNILVGPNMALRKETWNKVKKEICLDDNRVHEDIDLSIHLGKIGKIKFDPEFKVAVSARRIKKNPVSFFLEYPVRLLNTIKNHRKG